MDRLVEVDVDAAGVKAYHDLEVECYSMSGTLKQDFGPWKKGHHGNFVLSITAGRLTEYDYLGNISHEVNVRLEVV